MQQNVTFYSPELVYAEDIARLKRLYPARDFLSYCQGIHLIVLLLATQNRPFLIPKQKIYLIPIHYHLLGATVATIFVYALFIFVLIWDSGPSLLTAAVV